MNGGGDEEAKPKRDKSPSRFGKMLGFGKKIAKAAAEDSNDGNGEKDDKKSRSKSPSRLG